MTTTYEPNKVLSNEEFKVVGTRPIRPDGADKVTGRAQYGDNWVMWEGDIFMRKEIDGQKVLQGALTT